MYLTFFDAVLRLLLSNEAFPWHPLSFPVSSQEINRSTVDKVTFESTGTCLSLKYLTLVLHWLLGSSKASENSKP